jgi:hypothetical protein
MVFKTLDIRPQKAEVAKRQKTKEGSPSSPDLVAWRKPLGCTWDKRSRQILAGCRFGEK